MGQFATTFSPALSPPAVASKERLSADKLKSILQKSETELAVLPQEERRVQCHIRQLASMCGGWSEPENRNLYPDELTLREHCII